MADPGSLDAFRDYFARVFLDGPAADDRLPSLVYQDDKGGIAGFVGIVPRSMVIDGRRLQAAVSSQFIVDPSNQAGLVAVRLAKAFLEGPQDLSIADEANDVSKRMWEGLGGTTALLHSIYWTRPLRPARFGASFLRGRGGLAPLAAAAAAAAPLVDALAARVPHPGLRCPSPRASADDLTADLALTHLPELTAAGSLRADYDEGTLEWLLDRAGNREPGGRLLKALIRNGSDVLGWYVCHLADDGTADVAQIAAKPSTIGDVLDHLFHTAREEGAIAVTGRLDPRFIEALSDKYCVFHRRGPWVLVKAKTPALLQPFHNGTAAFSRIDGEWSLRFLPGARAQRTT
jgi:hypothetical protein